MASQLDARASQVVKQDPRALLGELSDMGFASRDIARMLGVSVEALRDWRKGDRPSQESRRLIARLLSVIQILRDDHAVSDPAAWMEVPIVRGTPVTAVDLYKIGHVEIIFGLAAANISPDGALDAARPDWRERYRSDWEVATAGAGERFIRPKTGS
jgi:transcriptional regulator with XRE-family HTH domain